MRTLKTFKSQLQLVPPMIADSGSEGTPNPTAAATEAPSVDMAMLAERIKTDEAEFHKLADLLYTSQQKYRQAAQVENSIWRWQSKELSDLAAAMATPVMPLAGADPRQGLLWCGVAAVVVGAIVARKACKSERVFQGPIEQCGKY